MGERRGGGGERVGRGAGRKKIAWVKKRGVSEWEKE